MTQMCEIASPGKGEVGFVTLVDGDDSEVEVAAASWTSTSSLPRWSPEYLSPEASPSHIKVRDLSFSM